jgi:hypothetical protein
MSERVPVGTMVLRCPICRGKMNPTELLCEKCIKKKKVKKEDLWFDPADIPDELIGS